MKRVLIICLAVLVTSVMANAQTVVGTKHDLSTTGPGAKSNVARVCVFCHTPHQASAANGQYPLWNHTLSSVASYGTYSSPTFNGSSTIADIGGATAGSAAVSNLCMSCHDGTVSVISMWNPPNEVGTVTITAGGNIDGSGIMSGTPDLGNDLTDDHPVNFTYDTALVTADPGLRDPTSSAVAALLISGKVQCSSCHDPHDNTNTPFLVMSNTSSALCTTCHIK